ncbi:MAG: HAMP domain-containing histidine kinase [Lachnospiraceae bacterium]|nr:HAMP domain-containing histidine kinase [Lachnospiraceae bacterium]
MRSFFRTYFGKFLLFAGCIVFALMLAGSAFMAYYCYEEDYYSKSEDGNLAQIYHHQFISKSYSLLISHLNNPYEKDSPETNLLYRVSTDGGDYVFGNNPDSVDPALDTVRFAVFYRLIGSQNQYKEYTDCVALEYMDQIRSDNVDYYNIDYSLREGLPYWDAFKVLTLWHRIAFLLRYAVYAIGLASLALVMICYISLLRVSARRRGSDELHPWFFHRVPSDLMLAGALLAGAFLIEMAWRASNLSSGPLLYIVTGIAVLLGMIIFLGLSMSFSARVKDRSLFRNTLIRRILGLLWKVICRIGRLLLRLWKAFCAFLKSIPLIWKTVLASLLIAFVELIFILANGSETDNLALGWLFEKLLLLPVLYLFVLGLRRLQKGGRALAAGDLSAQIPEKGLFGDLKEHADNLNHIGVGMSLAVAEQMKSERMKTELITNVSHDIKTPLTSIINYTSLIANEPTDNEKIKEYSEVLLRQSERLKRLIDDLVEASKASSGNLDVALAPCDASIFLTQAGGEYDEKLEKADLSLITKMPEEDVMILADSRRMWRIFDNLMNNICKYAQPGTRVYLSLEATPQEAVITFKNTSREALDISEEELMERFVRGDTSRSTEGNGLGLSIARSLAELQKGSLRLAIDGDLFKAILTFPRI